MDDAVQNVSQRVQELSDLELAALICLVADEHCVIATEDDLLQDLEQELRIVRFSPRLFHCISSSS